MVAGRIKRVMVTKNMCYNHVYRQKRNPSTLLFV